MTSGADLFKSLRTSTARMLSYNLDDLSPLQALRLDMVCSLHLEVDRVQAAQLRGEPADIRALSSSAEALESLIKPSFNTADDKRREDAEATAELDHLITGVLDGRDFERQPILERLTAALDNNKPADVVLALLDLLHHDGTADPLLDRVRSLTRDLIAGPPSKHREVSPPTDPDAPPPNTVRTVYLDAACTDLDEPPAAEDPYARYARLNPNGAVTPAAPKPPEQGNWRDYVDEAGIHVPGTAWSPRRGW
jgi:hypothetical protein